MSHEDNPDGPSGDFDGIAGIDGIDAQLDRVAGRDLLPSWFEGVTIDSAPAAMILALISEQEEVLDNYQTDPQAAKKLSKIDMRLDIISELHKKHRAMIKRGFSTTVALAWALDTICGAMEKDTPPFRDFRIDEWEPYVFEVAKAYKDFYNPNQPTD